MSRIHLLKDDVIKKISAGEVVERPSNVVKELVENSIDAGAKNIKIEFEKAGKKLIRVTDDGCGMNEEECNLSIRRFATSKIKNIEDIEKLSTMGFRGEALYSISAVSHLKIISRTKEMENAYELTVEGGKITGNTYRGNPCGTSVEVRNLFFNTPARYKFMKTDITERFFIIKTVEELAISIYETGFHLTGENKNILDVSPVKNYEERICDILGVAVYNKFNPVKFKNNSISIKGMVSQTDTSYSNKNLQFTYVNRRPITNKIINQAVYDSFRDILPYGRHPAFIIFIEIDPSLIDVNVHPTKRIIKFANDREIYDILINILTPKKTDITIPEMKFEEKAKDTSEKNISSIAYISEPQYNNYEQQNFLISESKEYFTGKPKIIGQFLDTYIIADCNQTLSIIDQHAAGERVLYEKFTEELKSAKKEQFMLIPEPIELLPHEYEIMEESLETLNLLGFIVEPFGHNTFIIKGYPSIIGKISRIKDFIREFIYILTIENYKDNKPELERRDIIIKSACSAAVKARDKLTEIEISLLINDLMKCKQPMCCPHGRPTIINITVNELAKKFKRT